MSVQLVLYPQRNPGAELLVDALNTMQNLIHQEILAPY